MNKLKKLLFIMILIPSALFAENNLSERNFHLSIEPLFGFRNGLLGEYVYEKVPNTETYKKLSQLDWDIQNQFFLGGKISAEYSNFNFCVYSAGFVKGNCGTMTDSDWIGLVEYKTNLSFSEETIENSFFIGSDLIYSFPFFSFFSLKTGINFEYEYFNIYGKNGYGWYGTTSIFTTVPWNSPNATFFPKGKLAGVEITRNSFYSWIFVEPTFHITKYADFSLFYKFSPYANFKSIDHHESFSRNDDGTYYYDNGNAVFKGHQLGFTATAKPTQNLSVSFSYKYHFIDFFYGKNHQNKAGKTDAFAESTAKSGFDEHWSDFTLSVSYRLF